MNGQMVKFGAVAVVLLTGAVVIVWQQRRIERLETEFAEFAASQTRQAYSQAYALRRDNPDKALRVAELQMWVGLPNLDRQFQELPEHHDRKALWRRLLTAIADYFTDHPPPRDYFTEDYDPGKVLAIVKKYRSNPGIAQPDGPANGSQPIRSETNRTSPGAGSRR